MAWHFLMTRLTVKDGERALLTRNGRLERVLESGRHRLFDPRHELTAEIFNVVCAELPAERYAVLNAARPDLAADLFEVVETKANEIAIVSLDGRPVVLMVPWQVRVYWKVATRVDVERIDVTSDPRISARHLAMIERIRSMVVTEAVVENHEAGLLYVEGRLVERLAPGRHAFWTVGRKIEVKRLDLRPQPVEITAQEMTELGVKDVILPGEIRELVNKVVEAERVAKANQIRRQEETAATRSLLNTAKLMEENPLLLRLKELESLERLVEKVGRIDLHAGDGQGFDALLNQLVRLKPTETA